MSSRVVKNFNLGQFVRFSIAGVLNTTTDWVIYFISSRFLFVGAISADLFSKTSGAVSGIIMSFIINSLWVFKDEFFFQFHTDDQLGKKCLYVFNKFIIFFITSSLGMGINILVFLFLKERGILEIISLVMATTVSMVFNFILLKKIVFKIQSV